MSKLGFFGATPVSFVNEWLVEYQVSPAQVREDAWVRFTAASEAKAHEWMQNLPEFVLCARVIYVNRAVVYNWKRDGQ